MGRLFTYMVKAAAEQQPAPYTENEYQAWLQDGAGFDSVYYHPSMEQRIFEDEKKYAQEFIPGIGRTRLETMPLFQRRVANVRNQQRDRGATYINNTLSQGGILEPWAVNHLLLGYGITPELLANKKFQDRISRIDADKQHEVSNAFRSMGINWDPKTGDYRDPAFIKSLQAGIRAGKWSSPASAEQPTPVAPVQPPAVDPVAPAAGQPSAAVPAAPVQPPAVAPVEQPTSTPVQPPAVAPGGTFNEPAFVSSPMQVSFYNLPEGMSQQEAMQNWSRIGNLRVKRYLEATGRQGAKNIQVSPDGSTIRFMHSNGGSTETDTALPRLEPPKLVRKETPTNLVRKVPPTSLVRKETPTSPRLVRKVTSPPTFGQKVTPPSTLRQKETNSPRLARKVTSPPTLGRTNKMIGARPALN